MIGKTVTVTVDRPLGSFHPEHHDMYYPVNYGYVEGVMAPDGEEQDAYILGVSKPVEHFTGRVIAEPEPFGNSSGPEYENGLAFVGMGDRCGYIDEEGREVYFWDDVE